MLGRRRRGALRLGPARRKAARSVCRGGVGGGVLTSGGVGDAETNPRASSPTSLPTPMQTPPPQPRKVPVHGLLLGRVRVHIQPHPHVRAGAHSHAQVRPFQLAGLPDRECGALPLASRRARRAARPPFCPRLLRAGSARAARRGAAASDGPRLGRLDRLDRSTAGLMCAASPPPLQVPQARVCGLHHFLGRGRPPGHAHPLHRQQPRHQPRTAGVQRAVARAAGVGGAAVDAVEVGGVVLGGSSGQRRMRKAPCQTPCLGESLARRLR